MRRLVRAWWAAWRQEPLRIRSSATPVAAARLLTAGGYWSVDTPDGRLGPLAVCGRASVAGVRLAVGRVGRIGRGMGPSLRGRFVAAPGGCELVGEFGYDRFGLAILGLWFGACGLVAIGGLVAFARALITGAWSAALPPLAVVGGAVVAGILHAVVVALVGLRRDRDDRFLRAWVTRRLASPSTLTDRRR